MGDSWAVNQVKELSKLCDDVKLKALAEGRTVDLDCEWDRQQGSGTHKSVPRVIILPVTFGKGFFLLSV